MEAPTLFLHCYIQSFYLKQLINEVLVSLSLYHNAFSLIQLTKNRIRRKYITVNSWITKILKHVAMKINVDFMSAKRGGTHDK